MFSRRPERTHRGNSTDGLQKAFASFAVTMPKFSTPISDMMSQCFMCQNTNKTVCILTIEKTNYCQIASNSVWKLTTIQNRHCKETCCLSSVHSSSVYIGTEGNRAATTRAHSPPGRSWRTGRPPRTPQTNASTSSVQPKTSAPCRLSVRRAKSVTVLRKPRRGNPDRSRGSPEDPRSEGSGGTGRL